MHQACNMQVYTGPIAVSVNTPYLTLCSDLPKFSQEIQHLFTFCGDFYQKLTHTLLREYLAVSVFAELYNLLRIKLEITLKNNS